MHKKLLILTTLLFVLASCAPAAQSQIEPIADVQSQVNTAVAQTMEVNTQIAQAVEQTVNAQQPAFTATAELPPSAEPTFEIVTIVPDTPIPPPTFPTNTPFVAQPPVQQAYDCFVETRSPEYLEEIKAGGNFEIKWFVRNTGTRAWDSGVDVKYASGPKMTTPERTEIKVAMNPGDVYKITLNAKAPNKPGTYTMTWIVEGQLCYANVTITVK